MATELESIQELLEDAMQIVEDPDMMPPGISVEISQAIAQILSSWIHDQLVGEDGEQTFSTEGLQLIAQLSEMATGCAYLVGRLEGMTDKQDGSEGQTLTYEVEPTHPEGQHVTINFNFR